MVKYKGGVKMKSFNEEARKMSCIVRASMLVLVVAVSTIAVNEAEKINDVKNLDLKTTEIQSEI